MGGWGCTTALRCSALHPRVDHAAALPPDMLCVFTRAAAQRIALQLLVTWGHGASSQPEGPLALVLLPTRELAQQVGHERVTCCAASWLCQHITATH